MTYTEAPATTDTLVVSEVFGPTIQGEGPTTGRRASFVRLGGCNLSCSWCDTAYTWDSSRYDLRAELRRLPVDAIAARALAGSPGLVIISGGEPLMHQHQPGWTVLLDTLTDAGADIEVETNGTIAPTADTLASGARFNCSPKLTHSGDPMEKRIRPEALAALVASGRAVFKFVCTTAADVDEAAELAHSYGIPPTSVWISPEGTEIDQVVFHGKAVAEPAIDHGFNVGTRLHALLWGKERRR
ncbi:7-carboxy-7-deazaguanine synthase QueE [Amycolatopsis sp. lyj-84]|uniref:7-carboxy-7-deazaguanine synthase QueE n=1 Tax=Amycolatopsis sp. lyj-84 TaxID=2789284 RepID=UPI00397983CA